MPPSAGVPASAAPRWKKLVVLGAVALVVAVGWRAGVFDVFHDPERVRALLISWGAWGWVLYVVAFALIEPLGVPGVVFVIPAGMIWPKPLAFALSLAGATLAGSVGFGFARFLARDWVERRLPPRFRRFDERLAERGLEAVNLVRVLFFLAPPAHWVLGLSKVRYSTFVLGSVIGFVPGIAGLTFVGGNVVEWLLGQPRWLWGAAAALLVVGVAARLWWARRRRLTAEGGR